MKITLLNNMIITYDNEFVYYDGKHIASYSTSSVSIPYATKSLGSISRIRGDTHGKLTSPYNMEIRTNIYDHTLREVPSDKIVATYDGTPTGAIACFLAHEFFEQKSKAEANSKFVAKQQNYTSVERKTIETNATIAKKEVVEEPVFPKQVFKPEEPVYKPEPLRYEEYKKEEFKPPQIPVPSGGNSENSTGGGCLGIIIAAVLIFFAIKLIPQSWKDLSTYIPEGDTGITICFFSSLIGAVLAVIVATLKKKDVFNTSMSTFLGVCGISVVINSIIQIGDILEGTYEFLGFSLIDIPLAIFASILGQFQFALPIGIGVLIICGIIHLAKKKSI